jgi:hypothetical protein
MSLFLLKIADHNMLQSLQNSVLQELLYVYTSL